MSTTHESLRHLETAPLGDVIDHILNAYHRPQLQELRRLESLARKVLVAHGDTDRARLSELLCVFVAFEDELIDHMAKEEQNLFPWVRRGQGAMAAIPAEVMVREHDQAVAALRRLRELTDNYQAPAGASPLWSELWQGLNAFDDSLQLHMHVENDILLPRAIKG